MVDKLHNKVFVAVNLMFINRIPSVVSVFRNITFNTLHNISNRNKATIPGVIDAIIAQYNKLGFCINTLIMDQGSSALELDIIHGQINFIPKISKENVGEVEYII